MEVVLEIFKTIAENPWILIGLLIFILGNYFYKFCTMSELEKAIEYKKNRHLMQISKEILIPTAILLYLMILRSIEFYSWLYVLIILAIFFIISGSIYLKMTVKTDNIRHAQRNQKIIYSILIVSTVLVSATILYNTVQILSAALIAEVIKDIPKIPKESPMSLLIELIINRNNELLLVLNTKLIFGYILLILIFVIIYILIRGLNLFVFNILKFKFIKIYDIKIDSNKIYKNVKILNRDSLFLYLDDSINNRLIAVRVADIQEIVLVEKLEK